MIHVIPHLIVKKADEILLIKRAIDQRIWCGHWHCVTGTIKACETPRQAIMREAKEEIGLDIIQPELVTVLSCDQPSILNPGNRFYSLELFFLHNLRANEVLVNIEPAKHSDIKWFKIDDLPEKIIPHVKLGIDNYNCGVRYYEYRSENI